MHSLECFEDFVYSYLIIDLIIDLIIEECSNHSLINLNEFVVVDFPLVMR